MFQCPHETGPRCSAMASGPDACTRCACVCRGASHPNRSAYDTDCSERVSQPQVPVHILEKVGARRFQCPIVLEGGSIHVDGEGCGACRSPAPSLGRVRAPAQQRRDTAAAPQL